MKKWILMIGILFIAMGLLWMGQSLGYILWPKSSFMIRQTPWKYYGAILVLVGMVLVVISKRRR